MKKIILLIVLLLIFFGCDMVKEDLKEWPMPEYNREDFEPLISEIQDEYKRFKVTKEIAKMNIAFNHYNGLIKYKSDDGDYWQPPWETIIKGEGDCEDIASTFMCVYDLSTGEGSNLELHCFKTKKKGSDHATVYNKVLDKYYYRTESDLKTINGKYIITHRFTFEETMKLAEYWISPYLGY